MLTVTTLDDSATHAGTSLRDAVSAAQSGDTVVFQSGLSGVLDLQQGQMPITTNLTINGPGAGVITIDAQKQSRIFVLPVDGITVAISGLTLTNGHAASRGDGIGGTGGAIGTDYSGGTLGDTLY